jgi:hypothetical protein
MWSPRRTCQADTARIISPEKGSERARTLRRGLPLWGHPHVEELSACRAVQPHHSTWKRPDNLDGASTRRAAVPTREDRIVLIVHTLTLPPPRTLPRGGTTGRCAGEYRRVGVEPMSPSSFRYFVQPAIDGEGIVKRVSSTGAYPTAPGMARRRLPRHTEERSSSGADA